MGKKNRAERRAALQAARGRGDAKRAAPGGLASVAVRWGDDFAVEVHEGGSGCSCGAGDDDLLFGCPTGKLVHGVSLRLDASPEEIERFREEMLRGGPDALLPCGTCRASAVFPIFD